MRRKELATSQKADKQIHVWLKKFEISKQPPRKNKEKEENVIGWRKRKIQKLGQEFLILSETERALIRIIIRVRNDSDFLGQI